MEAPVTESDPIYDVLPGRHMALLRRQLGKIAQSSHALLLTGESGVGKSHLAHAVHKAGPRADEEFMEISCAAIPATLLESELFGYCKGAFSGATSNKPGLLELADGGTVFLDEIGDMPLELQPKLLLFLQNQTYYPVGGREKKKVNVRLVAATNQGLKQAMLKGRFREDLYYRLNVFEIEMPPLRERREEIPGLALKFLREEFGGDEAIGGLSFSNEALDALLNYDWPGNIRELRNVMLRVATLVEPRSKVLPEHMPKLRNQNTAEQYPADLAGKTLRELEELALRAALDFTNGKKAESAAILGVSEKTVYNLCKRYGIDG